MECRTCAKVAGFGCAVCVGQSNSLLSQPGIELGRDGVSTYDYSRQTVVSGAQLTTFWKPLLARVQKGDPALLAQLHAIYATPDVSIDLTPNVDLWMIHDLGHACHLQHSYWFPRKWLMELFATLCLYTYIADQEPDLLTLTETFLRVVRKLPIRIMEHRTLSGFESLYLTLPIDNYIWFSGHFMQCAATSMLNWGSPHSGACGRCLCLAGSKTRRMRSFGSK